MRKTRFKSKKNLKKEHMIAVKNPEVEEEKAQLKCANIKETYVLDDKKKDKKRGKKDRRAQFGLELFLEDLGPGFSIRKDRRKGKSYVIFGDYGDVEVKVRLSGTRLDRIEIKYNGEFPEDINEVREILGDHRLRLESSKDYRVYEREIE